MPKSPASGDSAAVRSATAGVQQLQLGSAQPAKPAAAAPLSFAAAAAAKPPASRSTAPAAAAASTARSPPSASAGPIATAANTRSAAPPNAWGAPRPATTGTAAARSAPSQTAETRAQQNSAGSGAGRQQQQQHIRQQQPANTPKEAPTAKASPTGGGGKYLPPHRRSAGSSSTLPAEPAAMPTSPPAGTGKSHNNWSTLVPYHRNPSLASSHGAAPTSDALTLMFGDSFVGMFKLFDDTPRPTIRVRVFKGATASGLGKADNDNAKTVQQLLRQIEPGRVRALIFCFGQVDVHLTFYHHLLQDPPQELEVARIAHNYVNFARSVGSNVHHDCPRFVLAVYPSPVEADFMWTMLQRYRIVTEEQAQSIARDWDKFDLAVRHDVLTRFNAALERECQQQGGVTFLSINHHLMDDNGVVHDRYRDISKVNIHLLWEPIIRLWAETPLSQYGINMAAVGDLERSWQKYKDYKEGLLRKYNTPFADFVHEEKGAADDARTESGSDAATSQVAATAAVADKEAQ